MTFVGEKAPPPRGDADRLLSRALDRHVPLETNQVRESPGKRCSNVLHVDRSKTEFATALPPGGGAGNQDVVLLPGGGAKSQCVVLPLREAGSDSSLV